jgi:hypothetical protein
MRVGVGRHPSPVTSNTERLTDLPGRAIADTSRRPHASHGVRRRPADLESRTVPLGFDLVDLEHVERQLGNGWILSVRLPAPNSSSS